LLFQSKAILVWLWQNFPHHPLLLEASLQDLTGHYVRKPLLGREGQNVTEVDNGRTAQAIAGDFAHQPQMRQRFADLPEDAKGRRYQAGVFWTGAASAIGFRREKGFINNLSEFVPHIISFT
jgi:glutathionylspermidine synthase